MLFACRRNMYLLTIFVTVCFLKIKLNSPSNLSILFFVSFFCLFTDGWLGRISSAANGPTQTFNYPKQVKV